MLKIYDSICCMLCIMGRVKSVGSRKIYDFIFFLTLFLFNGGVQWCMMGYRTYITVLFFFCGVT